MQNTITARQISYNWVALIVLIVAIALLVGFVAGRATTTSASAATAPAMAGAQAQSSDRLLSLNEQFYPSNAAAVATQPQHGTRLFELNERLYPSPKSSTRDGCRLDRLEPDC